MSSSGIGHAASLDAIRLLGLIGRSDVAAPSSRPTSAIVSIHVARQRSRHLGGHDRSLRRRPLRPCILWNDGRSAAECRILEQRWPGLRATTGNKAMPGFTAPKLLWIATHEPEIFAATKLVLLPKAYLRLVLTGEAIEYISDASGTFWP